jgi:hypothetical protein
VFGSSEDTLDLTVTKAATTTIAALTWATVSSKSLTGQIKVKVTSAVPTDGTVSIFSSTSSTPLVTGVPVVNGVVKLVNLPKRLANGSRLLWAVYSGSDTTLGSASAKYKFTTKYAK